MIDAEHGALFLVDKPTGPTSHDIVRLLRRCTGVRRVGHGGTLDPLATGLLPVFVGPATRLNEYLGEHDKSYVATVRLGITTDTDDSEGETIATAAVPELSAGDLEAALQPFRGQIEQVPPSFSAVKVGGVTAHRAARRGEPLEIAPREVQIHELTLGPLALPELTLEMTVSTGTYVRAVARDLGEALGCGGHVVAMRRTRVGPVSADDAHTPEAVEQAFEDGHGWDLAASPARLFPHWPQFTLEGPQLLRVRQGQAIRGRPVVGERHAIGVDGDGSVVAVLRTDTAAPGRWQPEKVLLGL